MPDGKQLALSRRQVLGGLGAVGVASAGAGLGTTALFSDEESFQNNSITAGTTNLIVEASVVRISSGLANNGTVELVDATDDSDDDDDTLTVDGTPDPALGLTVSDMKPGDWFVVRLTVDVEANPMYVAAVVANTDDTENTPNPEPEAATHSAGTDPDVKDGTGAGNGSDAVGDGSGDDAGDLDNRLLVTVGYDGDQTSGGSADRSLDGTITPDPGLGFDGSASATATSFLNQLQGSGLIYRGQAGGTADPPGGHRDMGSPTRIGGDASESTVDREHVTHFLKFALPADVGNEIQGDSFSFDLGFDAEQARNNDDPFGDTVSPSVSFPNQSPQPP